MEYAAVKKNVENLYEWVWRDCQDIVLCEKSRVRTVLIWYANFCVNREENNKVCAQRNFERLAKKLIAGERAMWVAEGGWDTQMGDFPSRFLVT